MESSRDQSRENQNSKTKEKRKKRNRRKETRRKRKRKKLKKKRIMEVKKIAEKWEIWNKEAVKLEEETKRLVLERFHK